MLPFVLGQLEAVDLDSLVKTLVGAGAGSVLAGLIVRQWASNRLRELELLVKRAKRDAIRWRLLARYMKSQAVEQNRQRRNAHELRGHQQALLFALEQLAEATHVKVRLPEELCWESGELEPFDLQITDHGEKEEEEP